MFVEKATVVIVVKQVRKIAIYASNEVEILP
mgnify:FL=1